MTDKIRELELEIEKLKLQQATEDSSESTFSIWWFLFWLLVFWPAALVYVTYKHFNRG